MRKMTLVAAATLLALTGCSDSDSDGKDDKDTISGADVAAKAEVALGNAVDNLAEGSFECPDIDREVDATATCTRSSESNGYYLKVDGEVKVTEIKGDDFGLDVQMEDQPKEFGQSGEAIETDLSTQAETEFGETPTEIDCPDLPGENGATVTCTLTVKGEEKKIEVTASEVDLAAFTMNYTFREVS